jgi:alcohol dehydrogenase (cytochrome c)
MRRLTIAASVAATLVAAGAAGAGAMYRFFPHEMIGYVSYARNYIRILFAPPGTITTELNPTYRGAEAPTLPASSAPRDAAGDWPSYNKTLTSERFSELDAINTKNVDKLKVLCTYDTSLSNTRTSSPV